MRTTIQTAALIASFCFLSGCAADVDHDLAVVQTGETAMQTSLTPTADAYVKNTNANGNYGKRSTLLVDTSPDNMKTLLKFSVPALDGPVQSAKLRLYVTDPTTNGPKVYRTSSSWTETGVTWNNCPSASGSAIADAGEVSMGWYEFDVTSAVTASATVSFILVPDSSNGVDFASRGASNKPQLVISTGNTPPPPPPPPEGQGIRFVAYGDSRSSSSSHQQVVDGIARRNPQLVLHTGDLWDGYSASTWKSVVRKNSGLATLLDKNLFLVSRGNHESVSEVLDFSPPIVRENSEKYSFTFGNTFFVSLGYSTSSGASFLEQRLQGADASKATWRVVFSHTPVYSGGNHGSDGISAIERICDRYNVNLVFNGHDHIYERSHQMYGQQISDDDSSLNAAAGTVYIVAGGGGAPLYTASRIDSTHTSKSTLHFVDVTTTSTTLTAKATRADGTVFDTFVISR